MAETGDGNRTIQIDALTDVQLVAMEAATPSAVPPPLPRRSAGPSRARMIGLTALATIAGLLLAMLAVHYLFPPPAPPPSAVRRVQIDDPLVIHAGSTP